MKVQSCTKETRRTQSGVEYTGLKIDGKWLNCKGDVRNLYGKEIDGEIKGNWINLKQAAQGKQAAVNGVVEWFSYAEMLDLAHEKAKELEPDDAQARAALVNTAMIAFTNGKVVLPAIPDDVPGDDDVVPF